jgi:hypothetical protein
VQHITDGQGPLRLYPAGYSLMPRAPRVVNDEHARRQRPSIAVRLASGFRLLARGAAIRYHFKFMAAVRERGGRYACDEEKTLP